MSDVYKNLKKEKYNRMKKNHTISVESQSKVEFWKSVIDK